MNDDSTPPLIPEDQGSPPPHPGAPADPPAPPSDYAPPAASPAAAAAAAAADVDPAASPDYIHCGEILSRIRDQIKRVFLGQDHLVDEVLAALIAGGHVLIEGKPGLGKTHLVLALAKTFGGEFARIQFTPDLMPTDVTGHSIFDMASQTFRVRKGPVFANLLLADEINRAPAKTQAALLEVMQENQVTIDGNTMKLTPPFMTLATQNPIEQDGTYPLPEAQLDRFLLKLLIDYPDRQHESLIVRQAALGVGGRGLDPNSVETVCTPDEILRAQQACANVECVDAVVGYAVDLARATREATGISIGAGTRGAIGLVRVGKAYAVIAGRGFVTPDDIKQAAHPVLRHRITLSAELAISGQTTDATVQSIVDSVEAPRQ